jgi:hypothetical protein
MYEEIKVICKKGGDVFQIFNEGEVFFLESNYSCELILFLKWIATPEPDKFCRCVGQKTEFKGG